VLLRPWKRWIASSIGFGSRPYAARDEQRLEPCQRARGADVNCSAPHRVTGAERADVDDAMAELLQHRAHAGQGGLVPPTMMVACRRSPSHRSRHGASTSSMHARERRAERKRRGRVGRAHVDDHRAAAESGKRFEHGFAHRLAAGSMVIMSSAPAARPHVRELRCRSGRTTHAEAFLREIGRMGCPCCQDDEGYRSHALRSLNTSLRSGTPPRQAGTPQLDRGLRRTSLISSW